MKGEPLGPLHGLPAAIKENTLDRRHPHYLRVAALPGSRAGGGRGSRTPAQSAPALSCSPRPTCPNSPAGRIPTARCSGRHAIRGIRTERGGIVRRLGRAGRRPAWCRSLKAPISAARSASPPHFAVSSGFGRRQGLTPNYPMPLAVGPGSCTDRLARDAEDAALMLDAIVGFTRCRRFQSCRRGKARSPSSSAARTSKACASPMLPTSPASASKRRSTRFAAALRPRWQNRHAGGGNRVRRERRARGLSDLARLHHRRPAITERLDQHRPVRESICKATSRPA